MFTLIEFILNYGFIIILVALLLRNVLKYTSIGLIIFSLLLIIIYYTIGLENPYVIKAIYTIIDAFKIEFFNLIIILFLILIGIDVYVFAHQRSNIYNDRGQEIIFFIQNPVNIVIFIILIISIFFTIYSEDIKIEQEYDNYYK